MVRVVKNADRVLAGVLAGNLDRVFHGLGARVAQHGALRVGSRSVLSKKFGNAHVSLVGGHGEARVSEQRCLFRDRGHHGIVGVTNRGHANSRSEVDELIAVDVHHD